MALQLALPSLLHQQPPSNNRSQLPQLLRRRFRHFRFTRGRSSARASPDRRKVSRLRSVRLFSFAASGACRNVTYGPRVILKL